MKLETFDLGAKNICETILRYGPVSAVLFDSQIRLK